MVTVHHEGDNHISNNTERSSRLLETEIKKAIDRADAKIQYDSYCKKILGNKRILAWILQATIEDYQYLSIDCIIQCIESEPEIGSSYLDSGMNTKDKITGLDTEDKDSDEGTIRYDIRFIAYIPKEGEKSRIIINVEAQRNFYPGYPILSRGVYYGARMISSQNGVEFLPPKYGDIKKVYSIWLCVNAPQYIGNAISVYELRKRDIVSGIPDIQSDYDKISIVMICLNNRKKSEKSFFNMINTLFNPDIRSEDKKDILRDEYHIPMDDGLGKELELMCNVSEYLWEYAYENGMEAGMEAGRADAVHEIVKELLKDGTVGEDFIMRVTKISTEKLNEIKVTVQS